MSFLKYSPCETMHLCTRVFQLSKQLWNSCKVMPCRAIVVFAFTLSKSSKWFPLRSSSFWGPGKGHRVPNPVDREGGSVGSCIFCPKLSDTQGGVRWHTVAMKSPLPASPPVGEFSSHRVSHTPQNVQVKRLIGSLTSEEQFPFAHFPLHRKNKSALS